MNKHDTNHFVNGSPVYYNIVVSGTPNDMTNNTYYGEVNFTNLNDGRKIIVWFSYQYSTSLEAYLECYQKMQDYIATNPVIDL